MSSRALSTLLAHGTRGNSRDFKTFKLRHGERLPIYMDYFDLMKGFLLSPVETFRKVRDTDLGDSLKY
jgi:hypothetical protein